MARMMGSRQQWEELAGRANYDAGELARLCRLSDRQLRRQFRRRLDRTPQDWLNERRLIAARELLLSGQAVKEVAFNLGFKHSSHFCRQFKTFHHLTPSEFVSRQNGENGYVRHG